jgi:hypothetical protein
MWALGRAAASFDSGQKLPSEPRPTLWSKFLRRHTGQRQQKKNAKSLHLMRLNPVLEQDFVESRI